MPNRAIIRRALIIPQILKHRYPLSVLSIFIILFCLNVVFGTDAMSDQSTSGIARATDLFKDASLAREQGLVILIEFASDSCEYCRLLEKEFLDPMLINSEYDKKVMIRSVQLDGYESFRGFQGKLISPGQFASRYDIEVTPTMVFLDANGNELSDKLVGIWSVDFFGGYIDKQIDLAKLKVH